MMGLVDKKYLKAGNDEAQASVGFNKTLLRLRPRHRGAEHWTVVLKN